ncbi:MAG: M20/M25/M40 family metallo-hydrolase [Thermoanaerobaculia bacterium]
MRTLLAVVCAVQWSAAALSGAAPAGAPAPHRAVAAARAYRTTHEQEILRDFLKFLSIPNLASDRENIARNADAVAEMFTARGASARQLRVEGAPPLVVADLRAPGAKQTIAFYAHYDGQPVDPSQWSSPPWQPVIRDDRIYARSASDDKAPILAMVTALDALRSAKIAPRVNLRFVFEGEEEAGSPHLAEYLAKFPQETAADAWVLCDGPVHQSRRMQLYFGARGVTDLEITTYGPMRALHSGHYGNWAPNPIVALTHLIDSMRDADGRILIPGYYDDVVALSDAERQALAGIPDVDADLKRELALGRTEGSGRGLNELILQPALNVRGISSGGVGERASNTIQSEARASIDFRLVPNETPESVRDRVEKFISAQGWFIVRDTPDAATRLAHPKVVRLNWGAGYPPARTPLDLPIAKQMASIMTAALGGAPVRMPSLGGSIPMYLFQRGGTTPVIGLPIANHDNNQHAANENIRIQNLRDGIDVFAALFAALQ